MKKMVSGMLVLSLFQPVVAAASAVEPVTATPLLVEAPTPVLPANTEVSLRMNQTITTKGNTYNEGDSFGLTVARNVVVGGNVVIPEGARATGRIAWMTSKGAFGKSGKLEIAIDYVEVGDSRIPLEGTYRQEGEGNTVATVGGIIAVGVFAGFVTGKSAVIPQGRELTARTKQDVPVRLAISQPQMIARPLPAAPMTAAPQPAVPAIAARNVYVQQPAAESAPQRRAPSTQAQKNWGLVAVDAN